MVQVLGPAGIGTVSRGARHLLRCRKTIEGAPAQVRSAVERRPRALPAGPVADRARGPVLRERCRGVPRRRVPRKSARGRCAEADRLIRQGRAVCWTLVTAKVT